MFLMVFHGHNNKANCDQPRGSRKQFRVMAMVLFVSSVKWKALQHNLLLTSVKLP